MNTSLWNTGEGVFPGGQTATLERTGATPRIMVAPHHAANGTWGQRLKQVFTELPDPTWTPSESAPSTPVRAPQPAHEEPIDYSGEETLGEVQTFAGDPKAPRKPQPNGG